MIEENEQPNPDELLKAIQKEEIQKKFGRLKIFFGMSPGVGKTYAMLEEAQQKQKEGVQVVIGVVNTHGRKETEALVTGLTIIPEKWIKYKDIAFEEMDLEAILQMKPQLVLVDELAHSNVPGSKHTKRWQDVIEIIDAGIDVYTTMNVQHVESRKDVVSNLTGIQVRETVPDLILERATSIELIDIPPPELLQRLAEGKVYTGDQSKAAAENFFKEPNLMALREIALRFTAEKVDHDLHGILQGKGWKTRERLMVAISSSPSSEQLIRAARRLAFELDAPWIAVYVDTGVSLKDQDQVRLNRYFNLARDLGAEVITTHDLDIAAALQRIANQHDITRIVIGRPPKKKFSLLTLFQGSFVDRLENDNKHIDIVILRQEQLTNIYQRSVLKFSFSSSLESYGIALAFVGGITVLGLLVLPLIGYKSAGFIFLLGILILSFFVGRGPIFLAAFLSALAWDLLFIPPRFHPSIREPEDITLVVIYFFVAAITGSLASRMREQDQYLHRREEDIERLYEIERDIANATNFQYLRLNVISRLEHTFQGKFDILIKGSNDQINFDSQLSLLNTEKEKVTANWVFKNNKIGGWSTDTLPSAEGLYFPIRFSKSSVGVLVYFPKTERSLSMEEMNFIQTVAQQLGTYIGRYLFEEQMVKQDYSLQIERMHQSIFHSLNRSFYAPVDGILKIIHQLQKEAASENVRHLIDQIDKFMLRIKFTVENIITISELESGFIHFESKIQPIQDLIQQSLKDVSAFIGNRPIESNLMATPLLLPFDFNLLKFALDNLLVNASTYSDPSSPILVKVDLDGSEYRLSVLDEGSGIPNEILPMIFEKFYHAPEISKGLGLGLAIVKAVVDLHKGKIEVKQREAKGTEFTLILPR